MVRWALNGYFSLDQICSYCRGIVIFSMAPEKNLSQQVTQIIAAWANSVF
jgi:hypothetical protein